MKKQNLDFLMGVLFPVWHARTRSKKLKHMKTRHKIRCYQKFVDDGNVDTMDGFLKQMGNAYFDPEGNIVEY